MTCTPRNQTRPDLKRLAAFHQLSLNPVIAVEVTGKGRFSRDFAPVDKMRRAPVSVTSNVAEGFTRNGGREFTFFVSVAKGPPGELRARPGVASDRGYMDDPALTELTGGAIEIGRLPGGPARYLQQHGAARDAK
jgi:four helix bundle protein